MLIELLPVALFTFVVMALFVALLVRGYRIVEPGTALVIAGGSGASRVLFKGGVLLIPGLHRPTTVDLGRRSIEVRREGDRALRFAGGDEADVVAIFQVRVNPTTEDVLRAVEVYGLARLGDAQALATHLAPQLGSSLEAVAAKVKLEGISRPQFQDEVVAVIGTDLDGLRLDDAIVERLEPRGIT